MSPIPFRRFATRVVYVGAIALVSLGAVQHDVVTGLESTADWLSGLCVLGTAAAVVAMLHAMIGRD